MLYNLTGILSSEEKVEKLTVPYEHETVSNGLIPIRFWKNPI